MSKQIKYINHLRHYRKLKKYKQSEVAELLELGGVAVISQWERGITLPNFINLMKLCFIYQCLPATLYPELYGILKDEIADKLK